MKLELSKELIDEIDYVLELASRDGTIGTYNNRNQNTRKAMQYCLSLNLFRVKSSSQYQLDEKGIFAIQDGGIEKYLSNARIEKNLDFKIKELTRKSLKQDFKNNILYIFIGGLMSTIPLVINEYSKKQESILLNKLLSEKNELEQDLKKIQNHMNTLQLELKTEIDSLKNKLTLTKE
jgi:hypothetical protein